MSFLIDREGKVRFISIGGGEAETTTLGRMVKQLIDEGGENRAPQIQLRKDRAARSNLK